MNKYVLFEDPEQVKQVQLFLSRSGKRGGGYVVKLEQSNVDGTLSKFERTYPGKTYGEMGPKLHQIQTHLIKKGLDSWKIRVASKIMGMSYVPSPREVVK